MALSEVRVCPLPNSPRPRPGPTAFIQIRFWGVALRIIAIDHGGITSFLDCLRGSAHQLMHPEAYLDRMTSTKEGSDVWTQL